MTCSKFEMADEEDVVLTSAAAIIATAAIFKKTSTRTSIVDRVGCVSFGRSINF